MDLENSTELTEAQSGESAGAVAPQETETPTQAAEQGGFVDPHENDFALVDVGEDGGEGEEPEPQPEDAAQADGSKNKQGGQETPGQTREENAAYRSMRLRAQQEAEAAAAARADEMIAGMTGLRNPYTDQPFRSMRELREYNERVLNAELEQKAQQTGRSVAELREEQANMAYLTAQRREAERRNAQAAREAEQTRARRAFMAADLRDFVQKHPEVTREQMAALDQNAQFRQFCGTRYGREPLSQLYEDYVALVGTAGTAAVQKAASKAAKSTGGGTAGGAALTPAQKNALDAWNEEHPEMKMTAKEFLGR